MITVFAHHQKPGAAELVRLLSTGLKEAGANFEIESETARVAGLPGKGSLEALAAQASLLIVLGGDGTILRVMHRLAGKVPPVFGINIGSLGFLTCLGPGEYGEAMRSILAGDYVVSQRSLLRAEISDRKEPVSMLALNDVVVSRGARSQLVRIRVTIDGEHLTDYNADGLIVSTPTGSTAYSLSSGGPILMPDSAAFVITPICPHVLTNRSVVVGDGATVVLEPLEPGQDVVVTVDGREMEAPGMGGQLRVQRAETTLPLVMLPGRSFSEVLRQKLKWTGSAI